MHRNRSARWFANLPTPHSVFSLLSDVVARSDSAAPLSGHFQNGYRVSPETLGSTSRPVAEGSTTTMEPKFLSGIPYITAIFNFWEPLHFLDRGYGFQTWEVSPAYAIRSWAYIFLHMLPASLASTLFGPDKRPAFFAVRIFLTVISALCEAKFFRAVYHRVNERVARYFFFMLLFNAGMWNAASAFLPSSFAMYFCTLAFSYALEPPSSQNNKRTLLVTLLFATSGIVGWPFALALAIPFVFEELFVFGADRVPPEIRWFWIVRRWKRLLSSGITASLIFIPVIGIDSFVYGRLTIVPWNIVRYNIFGGSERGPHLYGTDPWYYYILNLMLNFNVIVPLALLSIPALAVTYKIDRKRLGITRISIDQTSSFTTLAVRLAPVYLWLGILTMQAHKEERFMFPAYPLLCFNAAVTLYLVRGWLEVAFIAVTKSPYKASQSSLFSNFTFFVVMSTFILSASRILALWNYYHAPLSLLYNFQTHELPRLLNETGLLSASYPHTEHRPQDLSPVHQLDLRLCFSKEWYRFSGHYLVPDGVRVDFVKSEFAGLLPQHFNVTGDESPNNVWWPRGGTRVIPETLNDLNQENSHQYVSIDACDYLVDLDFPLHPVLSPLEPRYAVDDAIWERVSCLPFLDARYSASLTRALWVPGNAWQSRNEFGDYCLLRNKALLWKKAHEGGV